MTDRTKVSLAVIGWLATVTFLHMWLNLGLLEKRSGSEGHVGSQFHVGFLPVTCHLTCPVTHFINETMTGDG